MRYGLLQCRGRSCIGLVITLIPEESYIDGFEFQLNSLKENQSIAIDGTITTMNDLLSRSQITFCCSQLASCLLKLRKLTLKRQLKQLLGNSLFFIFCYFHYYCYPNRCRNHYHCSYQSSSSFLFLSY